MDGLKSNGTIEYGVCRFPKRAVWIEADEKSSNVLSFKKRFVSGRIESNVVLGICGLGFYEAYLNGERISDEYFKPVFTDYEERNVAMHRRGDHTVTVDFFDVTSLLRDGTNDLEILVGDGYYRNVDKEKEPIVTFGEKKLIFEVFDGKGESLVYSDADTLVSVTGKSSTLFFGDRWDFTADNPSYGRAKLALPVNGKFVRASVANDRAERILSPIAVRRSENGYVYDFRINHSGGLRFSVKGKRGSVLKIEYAEVLNEAGSLNLHTSRWEHYEASEDKTYFIDQTSEYKLSGGEDRIYPLFCWRCYRYVHVFCEEHFEIFDMNSVFIHTDLRQTGKFSCSDARLMKIYDAALLTIKNNLHAGTLNDCPHREKRAYTGDGQLVSEALLYTFDAEAFLSKWLDDILCSQRDNGQVPNSAPYICGGGGYAWGNAIVEIPELLYRSTGKIKYVSRAYDCVKHWVEYCYKTIAEKESHDYGTWLLGDWLAPGITVFNIEFMSFLCLYRACDLTSRFAKLLKKDEDAAIYRKGTAYIGETINKKFFDAKSGNYCDGVQGENILPLYFGITQEVAKTLVLKNVEKTYKDNAYHIDTGIVGTKYIFETLIANGLTDTAFDILTNESAPSFSDMLNGETTMSEHWSRKWPDYKLAGGDIVVKGGGDLSHCHPMLCSVLTTLYKYVGGLDLTLLGEKKAVFAPVFYKRVEYASFEKETEDGKIRAAWKREGNTLKAELDIPQEIVCEVKNLFGNGRVTLIERAEEKAVLLPLTLKGGNYQIEYREE